MNVRAEDRIVALIFPLILRELEAALRIEALKRQRGEKS